VIAYKFLQPDRSGVLTSRLIRFTPPSDFNDPYEALPRVIGPSPETMRRQLRPGQDLASALARADAFVRSNGPPMVLREVSATFGALCLAGVADDPLLWGHYADGHRGFALGFDTAHEWFTQASPPDPVLDQIQEVTYQSDRPVIQMQDKIDRATMDGRELAKAMLFTKHESWRYESEWRLVRELRAATKVVMNPDGSATHLFEFPHEALSEVILGSRVADNVVTEVRRALATPEFRHVTLRQAGISEASFLLDIVDVK
jgi:hypothetical protein